MHAHQSEHADGASRGKQRALQPIGAGASMTLVDSDDITTSCNSGRRKTPDTKSHKTCWEGRDCGRARIGSVRPCSKNPYGNYKFKTKRRTATDRLSKSTSFANLESPSGFRDAPA